MSGAAPVPSTPKGDGRAGKRLKTMLSLLLIPLVAYSQDLSNIKALGIQFFYLGMVLANIVNVIANFEKVTDKNGSGERMAGLMNIAFMIIATTIVAIIFTTVGGHTHEISIRPNFK